MPNLLGIDISNENNAIYAIELAKVNNSYKLINFAKEILPANSEDLIYLSRAIKIFLTTKSFSTKKAAFAISNDKTIVKLLNLPNLLHEEEIKAQIKTEAQQHIFTKNIYYDYCYLEEKNNIYTVFTQAKYIENIQQIALKANLSLKIIDCELYAFIRALFKFRIEFYKHKVICVIKTTNHKIKFLFLKALILIFSYEANSINNLTDALTEFYGKFSHLKLSEIITYEHINFDLVPEHNLKITNINPLQQIILAPHINPELLYKDLSKYLIALGLALRV